MTDVGCRVRAEGQHHYHPLLSQGGNLRLLEAHQDRPPNDLLRARDSATSASSAAAATDPTGFARRLSAELRSSGTRLLLLPPSEASPADSGAAAGAANAAWRSLELLGDLSLDHPGILRASVPRLGAAAVRAGGPLLFPCIPWAALCYLPFQRYLRVLT